MSESKEDDSPRVWWKEIAKRHLWVRHFSAAIVGGTRHVNYLQRLGMSDDRIFRGYDTVDNGYFVDQVDQLRSADRSPLVVEHVGGQKYFLAANRFIRRKNLDTLIHAFHQFAENHETADQWSLVLLGDGPDLPYLKQLTERLDVGSRVLFPGFMSYEDICRWYASAEVFVHPAKSEQWGLVVNEAMAAGLPVLLSNACGCFPDLMVEEQTGFSFSPDNTDELASRMTRLAGDPELRTKMGHAAREHIQQHFEPAEFGRGLAAAIDAAT